MPNQKYNFSQMRYWINKYTCIKSSKLTAIRVELVIQLSLLQFFVPLDGVTRKISHFENKTIYKELDYTNLYKEHIICCQRQSAFFASFIDLISFGRAFILAPSNGLLFCYKYSAARALQTTRKKKSVPILDTDI